MTERKPVEHSGRALALCLLAWMVPTAGHFALGRRGRAAVFAAVLVVSVLVGVGLDGELHRVVPGQPLSMLFTLGAMGLGAPYFALRFLLGYQGVAEAAGFEYGTVFLLSAGLMNLLLVLDVWDIATGAKD
ncbi:MAG: hypothetical protein H6Q03_1913 [Acidobacteria bacterium]|nr:hypothetical protein [Acidobacteriota bacterium]